MWGVSLCVVSGVTMANALACAVHVVIMNGHTGMTIFNESGSSADLKVDERLLQVITGRVEMAVLFSLSNDTLRQEMRGGGFGRDLVGDEQVRVTQLNRLLVFDVNTEDSMLAGFAGYGIDVDLTKALTLSADYEAPVSKDLFGQSIRFGLTVAF